MQCADFAGNRRGSAAVEFALVAPVFFALLFAIIESAMVFFAGQVLETGVQDSGRLLYISQNVNQGAVQAGFLQPRRRAVSVRQPLTSVLT